MRRIIAQYDTLNQHNNSHVACCQTELPPPPRKMAAILADDIFKGISLNDNDKIPI